MAVVKRHCADLRCLKYSACRRTSQNGWSIKSLLRHIKTQLCTFALSLTLFSSVHLPREAFKHGAVPYLVVYSFWMLVVGLPLTLLQLAMGQLSEQDPVGVWRAVPIMRGVGHLRILTSYLCCVYNMVYVALVAAYLVWIGKGTFPLKDCTKLHITPNGYENRMNATECFNATFLGPFTEHPQYLGIMAILIFVLWFFVPILLYRLRKTLVASLSLLAPVTVAIAVLLSTLLGDSTVLDGMFESCEQWTPLYEPFVWHSGLVQALLSTQIVSGYLTSAGGSVYRHSDVRWVSASIIMTNIFTGWLWVLMWESIGGEGSKDTSFIAILVLIYQSSVTERRGKEWPLLSLALVLLSGIISILTLLFPVFDRLHRVTSDHWRLFATASSAMGTVLTIGVLSKGIQLVSLLDELVMPTLAVFTAAAEVVGFVFIYSWCYLAVDIEFLTGVKLPCFWIGTWWTTPVFLIGVTGWWLRGLIRTEWDQSTMWALVAVFTVILVFMVVIGIIAVAKEEQYNFLSKISSAFKPSRLWGPEEPLARYIWMSQRYQNEVLSNTDNEGSPEPSYPTILYNPDIEKRYHNDWTLKSGPKNNDYQRNYLAYNQKNFYMPEEKIYNDLGTMYTTHTIPRGKTNNLKKETEEKFRSPNICIAKGKLGGPLGCNCNRHFQLNVPTLNSNETTTSL